MRKLPKVLLQDSTQTPSGLATNFSADVIERSSQKILIVRENLSQFTRGAIIEDQTSTSLRNALLSLIIDLIPESGAEVRVDGATSCQALQKEAETPGTIFNKLNIKIVVGRLLNKNKNPIAENANQEVLKEILRHTNSPGPISQTDLTLILKNINSRIRINGYTAKEILLRRDFANNSPIDVNDTTLKVDKLRNREYSSRSSLKNKLKTHSRTPPQKFNTGDLVFLRDSHNKNNPRDLHIIEDQENDYYLIRKLNKSLRTRLYKALPDEMILAPPRNPKLGSPPNPPQAPNVIIPQEPQTTRSGRPLRNAAKKSHGINTVKSRSPPKIKCQDKFGWLTEDQDSDSDYIQHVSFSRPTPIPEDPTSYTNSSTDLSNSESDSTFSDTEQDLTWDSSPEQLMLMENDKQPSTEEHGIQPPIRRPTNSTHPRRLAVSEKSLTRSNAFKQPPDLALKLHGGPLAIPRSRTPNVTAPRKPSRIPCPTTPSLVDLHSVNDMSQVLPQTPQRSSIQFSHTSTEPPPYQNLPQNLNPPRRRSTRQQFNYQTYHKTGEKKPTQEKEASKEQDIQKKTDEEDSQPREPRADTLASGYQPAVPKNKQPREGV